MLQTNKNSYGPVDLGLLNVLVIYKFQKRIIAFVSTYILINQRQDIFLRRHSQNETKCLL